MGFHFRRYNFGLFSQANRALQAAIKVSLRIDDEGFLSLQMMMPPPVGKRLDNSSDSGIIEFKLTALQEED
jgi:cell cycle checkpoint protein